MTNEGAPDREYAPSKIVCVGRNYVEHISELGNEPSEEMVLFIKPNSAIVDVLVAYRDEPVHYEAEICYIVEEGRFSAVACGLDLTKRQLQSRLKAKGLPWERSKAFAGSVLFSPFVVLDDEEQELAIELYVNGELRQRGSTSQMIHQPLEILAEVQSVFGLNNGDIIMTGTPAGVGEVIAGAKYEARITAGARQLVSCSWLAK